MTDHERVCLLALVLEWEAQMTPKASPKQDFTAYFRGSSHCIDIRDDKVQSPLASVRRKKSVPAKREPRLSLVFPSIFGVRSVHDQVSRSGLGRRVFGQQPNAHLVEKFRRILRRIARRKGSKTSFRLHSTPLITIALQPLRLPC
jgi:hypothetical protein